MANVQTFERRLQEIGKKRARLADGYVSKVNKDGLVVFRPKRREGGFPIKGLALLVLGFFVPSLWKPLSRDDDRDAGQT